MRILPQKQDFCTLLAVYMTSIQPVAPAAALELAHVTDWEVKVER